MRRVVLAGALCVAVWMPSFAAWAQVASPSFEVAVIKPARPEESGRDWDSDANTTTVGNYPLLDLIMRAYNLKAASQVVDAPEWANKDRYDITAKVSLDEYMRLNALKTEESRAEYRVILQSLLAERFGLRVEEATRRLPRFALEPVSAGVLGSALKVTPAGPDGRPEGGRNTSRHGSPAKVSMEVSGATMDDVADLLSGGHEVGKRVVVNRTGMIGYYSFKLEYAPDNGMGVSPDATLPGLLDAIRQELGLKLVKDEGDIPVVIVKDAKQPQFD